MLRNTLSTFTWYLTMQIDNAIIVGRREQLNEISAYLDASIVYESTSDLTNKLRDLTDPRESMLRQNRFSLWG